MDHVDRAGVESDRRGGLALLARNLHVRRPRRTIEGRMPETTRGMTEVHQMQHSLRRREGGRGLALLVRDTLAAAASDVAIHALFATLAADRAVQIGTGLAEPHIIAFVRIAPPMARMSEGPRY